MTLHQAVTDAIAYVSAQDVEVPPDVWALIVNQRVFAGKHDGPGNHDNGSPQQAHAGNDYNQGQMSKILAQRAEVEARIAQIKEDATDNPTRYESMGDEQLLDVRDNFNNKINRMEKYGLDKLTPSELDEYNKAVARRERIRLEISRRRELASRERQLQQIEQSIETGVITVTETEMRQLLAKPGDAYRDVGYAGEYNPDIMLTSDLSGMRIRHYIRLPDGRLAHPDELIEARRRGRVIVVEEAALRVTKSALKATGDLAAINAVYHDAITESLVSYFEGGSLAKSKNSFKRAMIEAFGGAWDAGWDGNPPTGDALEWFNARTQQEIAFIDGLYVQAKELRKDPEADTFAWATARADGYTATVSSVHNAARMWAKGGQMLTWHLGNTEKHCETCAELDGKSHRASWYISRDYIPRKPGAAMLCGGYYCDCSLTDKNGKDITA
jgi:hypothetical protein